MSVNVEQIMRENITGVDEADHIGQGLAAMAQQQAQAMGPEKPLKPRPLAPPAPGSFMFRTKPGLRSTQIALRVFVPEQRYTDDQNRTYKNNWEHWAEREFGAKDKQGKVTVKWRDVLAADKDLYDTYGFTSIQFRPVHGAAEAYYQTRDPKIAAYIRARITEPELANTIYEEVGPTMAQLANGEWVEVLPATDQARQQMAAAAAAGA